MHKRNILANFSISQIATDIVTIFFSYLLASTLYSNIKGYNAGLSNIWICVIHTVIFVLSMFMFRMYNMTTFYYWNRIINRVFAASGIGAMCAASVIFMAAAGMPRLLFVLFQLSCFALVLIERLVGRWIKAARIGNGYTHVLFVGNDIVKTKYLHFVEETALKIKVDKHILLNSPEMETPQSFEAMLRELNVHEVMFVYSTASNEHSGIERYLKVCEDMGVTAKLIMDIPELPNTHRYVSSIGTYPVLTYHCVSLDQVQLFFKRSMDIVGSIIGIILFSPVLLVTAIAIKLESPGPVFFRQTRVGVNGRRFKIYKFRSMYIDAEERKAELMAQNKIKGGLMFKMDNDPRITKVGRFIRRTSIDELPQFFNVLRKEMSLVGTRPPTEDEVEKYDRNHWFRISIMPGITGMWQTNGRSNVVDFEQVVKMDREYIQKWTLGLDIRLIFKTFKVVLSHKGAS